MAAKAKPHAPQAAESEPQTIAEYQAAIANLTALHEQALADLDLAERCTKEAEEERKQAENECGEAISKAQELEDEVCELRGRVDDLETHPIGSDEIEDLARIRVLLKGGNVDAARDGLERLLDGLDGCWRTRAATVIGQGALL